MEEQLRATLSEIKRIEGELRENGDVATLSRFGDPDHGYALATAFGYETGVTTDDARVLDQLSRMPDGPELVRDYLRSLLEEPERPAPAPAPRGSRQAPSSRRSGPVSSAS